jgi:hypothetical protein
MEAMAAQSIGATLEQIFETILKMTFYAAARATGAPDSRRPCPGFEDFSVVSMTVQDTYQEN